MIIALTAFKLPQPITREQARSIFKSTAPTYQGVPGLFRKHYVLSEDGQTAGGVYLWNSRAEAEALYTESWRAFVRDKYGTDPTVTCFDSPVVVDNVAKQVCTDAWERRVAEAAGSTTRMLMPKQEAIRDARGRFGAEALRGAVLYSTFRDAGRPSVRTPQPVTTMTMRLFGQAIGLSVP